MKIAVMGAGGVGSYLGGMLAQAGVDVTLIARGKHLEAMRKRGLTIHQPDGGRLDIPQISATDRPQDVGPVDAVILTTKLYDLAQACSLARPLVGPHTAVVPVQNGVTAAAEIAAHLGEEAVVGGVVHIASFVEEPGVVHVRSPRSALVFGELAGNSSGRLEALRDLGTEAGLAFRISDAIEQDIWNKFVLLAGFAPVSCLARQPIGAILKDPDLRRLFERCIGEVVAVARSKGFAFDPDVVEKTVAQAATFNPDAKASMLEDLEAGKPLELDWISGAVSRFGRAEGVATPVHDLAYACLKPFRDGTVGAVDPVGREG